MIVGVHNQVDKPLFLTDKGRSAMLRDLYAQEWEHFRQDYKKSFWTIMLVSLVIAVVFYMLIVKNPQTVKELLATLAQAFEAKGIKSGGTSTYFFWTIFKNNVQATFLSVLVGIIPLIILPAFSAIITISTISILLASVAIQNQPWINILVYGILPHGIIEMIAIFLSGSVGIFLSLTVFRRLFSRNPIIIPLKKPSSSHLKPIFWSFYRLCYSQHLLKAM